MIEQAIDFKDESEALYKILGKLSEEDFATKTAFKNYTIHDVLCHLHLFNQAVDLSIEKPEEFEVFAQKLASILGDGGSMIDLAEECLDDSSNLVLLENWRELYLDLSDKFYKEQPKKRLAWFGPDMSARSSVSARLMETWAHGQAIYDLLGIERINTDSIKNIAFLGVNTFAFCYQSRNLEVPTDVPYVKLTAPSGVIWQWNAPSNMNSITGSATEFCQVVTQVRNIADTKLELKGKVASHWMSIAQCFAGPAETPPIAGSRRKSPIDMSINS
ncbi:MAG: TIGR03084 family protein [Gammaproteobacteria bacterium]|nr:MAG: TIGR03084 family protein [Gammaproteobacteria bacterium]